MGENRVSMRKVKRKMINIEEDKCTGCGLCITSCPEGALQIVNTQKGPKAKVVKEFFCDGLGACIGDCPEGALTIEEKEVEKYDEKEVMKNIIKGGREKIKEHLDHLKAHNEEEYIKEALYFLKEQNIDFPVNDYVHFMHKKDTLTPSACPGSKTMFWGKEESQSAKEDVPEIKQESQLHNWPVQLMLVNPDAPYLKNANLLISADCVPFAYAAFHNDFAKEKVVLIGCPKLDDIEGYIEKLAYIFKTANPKSITVTYMEVPCCYGLVVGVQEAIKRSGKKIPFCEIKISLKGKIVE